LSSSRGTWIRESLTTLKYKKKKSTEEEPQQWNTQSVGEQQPKENSLFEKKVSNISTLSTKD